MPRQRKNGKALAAPEENTAPAGERGPVATALEGIIAEELAPNVERAKAAVARTETEHAKAIEHHAANPTDTNNRAVHETWVAMQTAPAIEYRAESVLKGGRELAASDDTIEADRLLSDDAGSREAFASRLDELLFDVRKNASALGVSVKAVYSAHADHTKANAAAKNAVDVVAHKLASLHEPGDLMRRLGKRALEAFEFRSVTMAVARSIKSELAAVLGREKSRKLVEDIPFVSLPR